MRSPTGSFIYTYITIKSTTRFWNQWWKSILPHKSNLDKQMAEHILALSFTTAFKLNHEIWWTLNPNLQPKSYMDVRSLPLARANKNFRGGGSTCSKEVREENWVMYVLRSQQFLKAHLQHIVLKYAFNFALKWPNHAINNEMTWVQRMDWYPGKEEKPNYYIIMCFRSKCT
jgi:hypothetical protein